jgi:hypothetical protein
MSLFLFMLACGRPSPEPVLDSGAASAGSGEAATSGVDSQDTVDSGGGEDTADSGGGDTAEPSSGFRGLILPLYAERCEDCHGYWGSSEEPDALWASLVEGEQHSLITAGDPAESMFYTKMLATDHADFPSGGRMPYQANSVSSNRLDALRDWISSGAEEDGFEAYTDIHDTGQYKCKSCHSYFGAGSETEMYAVLMAAEMEGYSMVVPGEPDSSLLYLKVSGGEPPVGEAMPLNYAFLDDDELAAVESWILSGAAND